VWVERGIYTAHIGNTDDRKPSVNVNNQFLGVSNGLLQVSTFVNTHSVTSYSIGITREAKMGHLAVGVGTGFIHGYKGLLPPEANNFFVRDLLFYAAPHARLCVTDDVCLTVRQFGEVTSLTVATRGF
jgi:hypothetical protein